MRKTVFLILIKLLLLVMSCLNVSHKEKQLRNKLVLNESTILIATREQNSKKCNIVLFTTWKVII